MKIIMFGFGVTPNMANSERVSLSVVKLLRYKWTGLSRRRKISLSTWSHLVMVIKPLDLRHKRGSLSPKSSRLGGEKNMAYCLTWKGECSRWENHRRADSGCLTNSCLNKFCNQDRSLTTCRKKKAGITLLKFLQVKATQLQLQETETCTLGARDRLAVWVLVTF